MKTGDQNGKSKSTYVIYWCFLWNICFWIKPMENLAFFPQRLYIHPTMNYMYVWKFLMLYLMRGNTFFKEHQTSIKQITWKVLSCTLIGSIHNQTLAFIMWYTTCHCAYMTVRSSLYIPCCQTTYFQCLTLWSQWWGTPGCRWFWCSWQTCRCCWSQPSAPPAGWRCRCRRTLEQSGETAQR